MKKKSLFLLAALLFLIAGCNNSVEPEQEHKNNSNPVETPVDFTDYNNYGKDITDVEIVKEFYADGFRKIVFDYPSVDFTGKKVRLSGIICIKTDFYKAGNKKADYTILVNHGATTKWDDCPSRNGGSELCSFLSEITEGGAKVIGIAADYIGLGSSKNELQAFVFGELNAKASLDALIWGRKLLAAKGFSWEDKLANIGFSQGGQTAICVQKLADTDPDYSEITISKTFAGDGVYDIQTMIEESLNYSEPVLPSVVCLGIASYNRVLKLGLNEADIFVYPDLIEEYVLSKKYGLVQSLLGLIEALSEKTNGAVNLANYYYWSHYLKADMLNKNSDLYKSVIEAVKDYNNFWTPKDTTKIVLFAAENDDVVPCANSDKLFEHLKSVASSEWNDTKKTTEAGTAFSGDNIYIRYKEEDKSSMMDIIHAKASNTFKSKVNEELLANW